MAVSIQCGDILDFLLGAWAFEREVTGMASGEGTAFLRPLDEDTALYEESAQVQLMNGHVLHGTQRYLYCRRKDGPSGLDVLFYETGRIFHQLRFQEDESRGLVAAGTHWCSEDCYRSRYELRDDGRFIVQHTVRGPRKNYTIRTVYSRK
jgi:hypothetical protein